MRLFVSGPRLVGGFRLDAVSAPVRPTAWMVWLGLNLLLVALTIVAIAAAGLLFLFAKDILMAGTAPAFR